MFESVAWPLLKQGEKANRYPTLNHLHIRTRTRPTMQFSPSAARSYDSPPEFKFRDHCWGAVQPSAPLSFYKLSIFFFESRSDLIGNSILYLFQLRSWNCCSILVSDKIKSKTIDITYLFKATTYTERKTRGQLTYAYADTRISISTDYSWIDTRVKYNITTENYRRRACSLHQQIVCSDIQLYNFKVEWVDRTYID